ADVAPGLFEGYIMNTALRSLVIAAIVSSSGLGQIVVSPDAELWGGGTINPSGDVAVPILQYDPANGEMWINTVGLNGVSDTASQSQIGQDDVGMVALSIEGPAAILTGPEFSGFNNGLVWNSQYFAGKQQLFTTGSPWLAPTEGMHLWTFDAGLSPTDFGTAEMEVNFGTGIPGTTIFGGVQFVPEPSSHLLLLTLALMTLPFIRKANQ
ncbi:MAG: hypothetical protein AAF497_25585, partial [Planctomycetota bacterium]